jgi:hypothetical protein
MKTIKQVFGEFLKEQGGRLKPGTLRGYEDAIRLIEGYLNGYAANYLDKKERARLKKAEAEEKKEFCDVFGPDKIGSSEIGEFLDYYMVRKVIGSKELMKTVGRVMRAFVKWMHEKGYMEEEDFEASELTVDELKDDLPLVEELACLIFDFIENNPPEEKVGEERDSYFRVKRIGPGKLWLVDFMTGGKEIGPVPVSGEISSGCKEGWVICLTLGKTRRGWRMLQVGNVYPR